MAEKKILYPKLVMDALEKVVYPGTKRILLKVEWLQISRRLWTTMLK